MKTKTKMSHVPQAGTGVENLALTKLNYLNPKTNNIIGYSRAHSLGLIEDGVQVVNPRNQGLVKLDVSEVMKRVKKSMLKYLNPKTKNIVGYFRAVELHLTTQPDVKFGLINPKTGKLVGLDTAEKLGLIKNSMLRHAA